MQGKSPKAIQPKEHAICFEGPCVACLLHVAAIHNSAPQEVSAIKDTLPPMKQECSKLFLVDNATGPCKWLNKSCHIMSFSPFLQIVTNVLIVPKNINIPVCFYGNVSIYWTGAIVTTQVTCLDPVSATHPNTKSDTV